MTLSPPYLDCLLQQLDHIIYLEIVSAGFNGFIEGFFTPGTGSHHGLRPGRDRFINPFSGSPECKIRV